MKLQAIDQKKDQKVLNTVSDWSAYKKGNRTRLTFFQMNNESHDEYVITFQLDKVVEMRQFLIGFNSVWTDFADKVLGIP